MSSNLFTITKLKLEKPVEFLNERRRQNNDKTLYISGHCSSPCSDPRVTGSGIDGGEA